MLPPVTSWYILRTNPHAEKKVAQRLAQLGIPHFVALQTQVRQWHDRKKKLDVVLIPGYVFVQATEAERRTLFPDGSRGYLTEKGVPATLSGDEIERLRRICAWEGPRGSGLQPAPGVARQSRCSKAIFAGFRGEVSGHQGRTTLRLVLGVLGCTMLVNITGVAVKTIAPRNCVRMLSLSDPSVWLISPRNSPCIPASASGRSASE